MLMNYWYAVEHASKITPGKPHAIKALGEDLVIWRKQNGDIVAQSDLCVHRGALLSGGELIDDCLVCPYHGWEFNDQGKCQKIPANLDGVRIPRKAQIRSSASGAWGSGCCGRMPHASSPFPRRPPLFA